MSVLFARGEPSYDFRYGRDDLGLSQLGFVTLPMTANISNRAITIMEETALKSGLGVCDALVFATACETGETLLSGNRKYFKEVPLLNAVAFVHD